MTTAFRDRGWTAFPPDAAILAWAQHAHKSAKEALTAPEHRSQWQCEGTWFVGLEALQNDEFGQVAGGPPLGGDAVEFAAELSGGMPPLHPAQVSVVRPGYPRPRRDESEAAFRYRLNRDAAHVDGILALGDPKRRYIREPHAFVLGIPLNDATAEASAMVVWDGSHEIMRKALLGVLQAHDPDTWHTIDVTDAYVAARKVCFDICQRVRVHVPVGGTYVVHRLALHGVAPWGEGATSEPEGRMIAYLRPELPGGLKDWLGYP